MAEKVKPIKTERIDNPDGTYIVKSIFENNKDYLSEIENYTKDDELFEIIYYKDSNFNDICCKQINNFSNKTTIIFYYNDKIKYFKCEKKFYNKYSVVDKIEYYSDYELKNLYANTEYRYYPFHIERHTVFKQEHKGYFSCIEYSKLNGSLYKATAFCDKCYKNVYLKAKTKYLKNDDAIVLRIYSNRKENKYFSEIEKFDSNRNSLYKKQYKFKGILAHILFWLAR